MKYEASGSTPDIHSGISVLEELKANIRKRISTAMDNKKPKEALRLQQVEYGVDISITTLKRLLNKKKVEVVNL